MKPISKSIRMTHETHELVQSFPGKGFNEKFENLAIFCLKEESRLKKTLEFQRAQIENNNAKIREQRATMEKLKKLSAYIETAVQAASDMDGVDFFQQRIC